MELPSRGAETRDIRGPRVKQTYGQTLAGQATVKASFSAAGAALRHV